MAVLLDQIVAEHRDENAIVDSRGATTWGQLNERVERLVHALRDRGLTSGDCVMSMLGNQAEAIEVALACAHGGWLLVPVNWHWVADEVAYVLGDTAAAAIVVDRRWIDVVADALAAEHANRPGALIVVDGTADGFEDYQRVVASGAPGEIADAERGGPMFYTSGTTGRPKGVRSALGAVGGPPEVPWPASIALADVDPLHVS